MQLYSSNKTRSNEELRLNIEDRKYDLEREKIIHLEGMKLTLRIL